MLRKVRTLLPMVTLGICMVAGGDAMGQCLLSNPSFEVSGSGGSVFGGWNQFGSVGSTGVASHGFLAARVSGPNNGGWDVSGFWQTQDCIPGEQWQATGTVYNPANRPLVGQNKALVNIEWRDASDVLIDYDSFTVADASSPTDQYLDFAVTSIPAPEGTAKARILVGVLQSPADPVSDSYFDQLTFVSTSPPTIDDIQWTDFPGGRTLDFGGYSWRVKGTGYFGPGPNVFSDDPSRVWVDGLEQLHLTLKNVDGTWNSTEVVLDNALGYGDYTLVTKGQLDQIDPQAVLGMFLWEYGSCWDQGYLWWNPYNEIDIEYSRWEDPNRDIAQFVAQPYDWPGNILRFDATFDPDETVSHAMRWLPDKVEYRVWRGGLDDESPANMIAAWVYTGPHIPRPEQPRMHLNLWRIGGSPAGSPATDQEAIFSGFRFVPAGAVSGVGEGSAAPESKEMGWLSPASPNPFNPRTTLRFTLVHAGFSELKIYDLQGRAVRTLASNFFPAGQHSQTWNGRNEQGGQVASGVYFSVLRGQDFLDSRRLLLLK